jgi:hypothetical protein
LRSGIIAGKHGMAYFHLLLDGLSKADALEQGRRRKDKAA